MNYDTAVTKYYSDKEIIKHLEIAEEIAKNPSKLHSERRHKNAIKATEFDWNVFARRIVHLQDMERTKDDPLQKCRLAIGLLNADLSYDNKNKARQLLHEIVELVTDMQEKLREKQKAERAETEEIEKGLLVSTQLQDDNFWQNIAPKRKQKYCPDPGTSRGHTLWIWNLPDGSGILDKEKERYQQLRRESVHHC